MAKLPVQTPAAPPSSVPHPEAHTSATADERSDLLPKCKVLESKLPLRPDQRPHGPEEGPKQTSHSLGPYPPNARWLKRASVRGTVRGGGVAGNRSNRSG